MTKPTYAAMDGKIFNTKAIALARFPTQTEALLNIIRRFLAMKTGQGFMNANNYVHGYLTDLASYMNNLRLISVEIHKQVQDILRPRLLRLDEMFVKRHGDAVLKDSRKMYLLSILGKWIGEGSK